MEVKKLKAYIAAYRDFLQQDRKRAEIYKWEALDHFQQNWDAEAPDFKSMYEQALQSNTTQRLWKRETWRPKEVMLKLIALDTDFARNLFRQLLDEGQNVETRISRFKFGCEELLRQFKTQYPTSIENNHYHDDNEMILLYLSFRHPEQYTFFDFQPFAETMRRVGVQDIPTPYELDRFFKLTNILYTFLKKDEELLKMYQNRLPKDRVYQGASRLIVHDFYTYIAQRKEIVF